MSKVYAIEVTERYYQIYHVKANSYEEASDALSEAFCDATLLSPAFSDGTGEDNYELLDVYDLDKTYIDLDATEENDGL